MARWDFIGRWSILEFFAGIIHTILTLPITMKPIRKYPIFLRCLFLFLLSLFDFRSQSASVEWTGAGDGVFWNDARNWTGNALPTSVDEVIIGPEFATTIILEGAATILSLENEGNL